MLILLVEDDPAQLEPLQAALSQVGHIVDAVEEGSTAQWLIQEKRISLVNTKKYNIKPSYKDGASDPIPSVAIAHIGMPYLVVQHNRNNG